MAKKRSISVFDLPKEELDQVSKSTIERTAKPKSDTQRALAKAQQPAPQPKPAPKPAAKTPPPPPTAPKATATKPIRRRAPKKSTPDATEPLKVIRVRESFHRRAKSIASQRGMSLGAFIEELIERNAKV